MINDLRNDVYDTYLGWIRDLGEDTIVLAEIQSKITGWLVSLSTGAIALIISQVDKLPKVSTDAISLTLLLLIVSIISMIISRWMHRDLLNRSMSWQRILQFSLLTTKLHRGPKENETAAETALRLAYMEELGEIDDIISASLGYSAEEYEQVKKKQAGKFKRNSARARDRVDFGVQLFYRAGLICFMLAVLVLGLSYVC